MSDDKAQRNAQMERFAELLEDAVREVKPSAGFSWRKMFGGAGYYADGVMFAGMYGLDTLGLKLAEEDCQELLALEGAESGMGKNTVNLPLTMLDDPLALHAWVSKSLDYAASRPQRKKKSR